MKTRKSATATYLAIGFGFVVAGLVVVSCGTERPDSATSGGIGGGKQPGLCATPNEGCECLEPGKVVECGQVKAVSEVGGYVACSMGTRQCVGGKWGACVGTTDVVKPNSFVAGGGPGGIHALALGAGAACPTTDAGVGYNPCDPYCNQFVDDPVGLVLDGGLVVIDGGITIPPNVSPDGGGDAGGGPPIAFTTVDGNSNCAPGPNHHYGLEVGGGTNCSATPYTTCQQDFRCITATGRCEWNGTEGYFDSTVATPDLTIGSSCDDGANERIPVCNRGGATVAPTTTINLYNVGSTPIADSCTPPGVPACTGTVGALGLAPGKCMSIVCNVPGNKYYVVKASPDPETTTTCQNNQAFAKNSGTPGCAMCAACDTRITGKVYDPSGAPPTPGANNIPLAGIAVFEPAGPLTALNDGRTCDTCASIDSPAVARAVTDATGSFTLSGVTPGPATRLVVQSGRWRREITVPVTACGANPQTAGTVRMPQSRTDFPAGGSANLPKMALVSGSLESLMCMVRKIGIAQAEIGPHTGAADGKRVQVFRYNGMNTSPGAPASTTLYNAATLDLFTAVLSDCPSTNNDKTPAHRTALLNYANAGGRIFSDHWAGVYALNSAEWPATSTWLGGVPTPSSLPARGRVLTGTPPKQLFNDWLTNVGATTDYGAGWLRVDEARNNSITPGAGTVEWLRGKDNNSWGPGAPPGAPSLAGDYSLSYSFETPLGGGNCGVPGGTGRVLYNGMHVSPARGTTGTFPGNCNFALPLSPEEKALEYQIFQLTACQLGGNPPPPPPIPPAPLVSVTYQRDYQAVCPVGTRVKWGPTYWQAIVPPLTNITFRAATSNNPATLPPSPPAAAPTTALVGTATTTTLPVGAWDCNGCPGAPVMVDTQLQAQTGTPSGDYLRLYMTFNPTPVIPPTLLGWRQIYDCVPAE